MATAVTLPTPLLQVSELRKTYPRPRGARFWARPPEVVAVDGVSFELRSGETLALVGESGSGKSTTARCVMRLVPVTSGRVALAGRDITDLRGGPLRRLRREIQIVFQDPKRSFDPRLRVGRSLSEPLRIHGIPIEGRIDGVLDKVGLSPAYARRFPHELSGGELQRLAIARALVVEPRLIVLDEPVSALDVSVQAQIVRLLSELQRATGVGYLLIAHDLAVVRDVAHRVAVMHTGRIIEQGPAEAVFTTPSEPYTRQLLEASMVPQPASA